MEYRLDNIEDTIGRKDDSVVIYGISFREFPGKKPKEVFIFVKVPFGLKRSLTPKITDSRDIQSIIWEKIRPWMEERLLEGVKTEKLEYSLPLKNDELLEFEPKNIYQPIGEWTPLDKNLGKNIVFISCGQASAEEKKLGKQIVNLVRELTSFEPYFAEFQKSFQGLTQNIFGKLKEAVGFITVMHCRGKVKTRSKEFDRASVWLEQEIAIAAFIEHTLKKTINVAAFNQKGIQREGVREYIILNPTEFQNDSEVLDSLRLILPTWVPSTSPGDGLCAEAEISYDVKHRSQDLHKYSLKINLQNKGSKRIADFRVDVLIPRSILSSTTIFALEQVNEGSRTHRMFRVTENEHRNLVLYRGDNKLVMTVDYFIDEELYVRHPEVLEEEVIATVYSDDMSPRITRKAVKNLQEF